MSFILDLLLLLSCTVGAIAGPVRSYPNATEESSSSALPTIQATSKLLMVSTTAGAEPCDSMTIIQSTSTVPPSTSGHSLTETSKSIIQSAAAPSTKTHKSAASYASGERTFETTTTSFSFTYAPTSNSSVPTLSSMNTVQGIGSSASSSSSDALTRYAVTSTGVPSVTSKSAKSIRPISAVPQNATDSVGKTSTNDIPPSSITSSTTTFPTSTHSAGPSSQSQSESNAGPTPSHYSARSSGLAAYSIESTSSSLSSASNGFETDSHTQESSSRTTSFALAWTSSTGDQESSTQGFAYPLPSSATAGQSATTLKMYSSSDTNPTHVSDAPKPSIYSQISTNLPKIVTEESSIPSPVSKPTSTSLSTVAGITIVPINTGLTTVYVTVTTTEARETATVARETVTIRA